MLLYLCFKPTRSYRTHRHTQRIIFPSPSVAKVANDRVGRGEFGVPPRNVQSPFIWANQTLTTSVCMLQTVQSSCSNSLEPQVLICYLDLIASKGFICEFHHAYNTDGDGIWFVKVQSWIDAFLFLITHENIEISLNKHQRPALSRVFLKVMDHSWNRSAA